MSINSSTGAPFGTPTVAGTFNVTVTVRDSSNPQLSASKVLPLTVTSAATYPSAPQNLAASAGNGQVSLSWQTPASNGGTAITGYRVYRSTNGSSAAIVTNGGCASLGVVLACTDMGLTNGQAYTYFVIAFNSVATGAPSDSRTAAPGAPGILTATTDPASIVTQTSFRMNGLINPNGVTTQGYFQWGTSPSLSTFNATNSENIGNGTSAVPLSFSLSGRSCNTTYYFQVVAVRAGGSTVFGTIREVTTAPCPTQGCQVQPLNPITDPEAQFFEDNPSLRVDTVHLKPEMQIALNNFGNAIAMAGGHFELPSVLDSAYRPSAYQVQKTKNLTLPVCQTLRTQVEIEANGHEVANLEIRPAGATGTHTQGLAIDVKFAATGLESGRVVALACQSGLIRPNTTVLKDKNHFVLGQCNGVLSSYEEDGAASEGLSDITQAIPTFFTADVFVTVSKQIVNNNYVYSYRVRNNDSRPILAFEVGHDDSTNASQLSIPPVDWSYDEGLSAASTTSPTDWSTHLITTQESEFHSIEWRTPNTNQNIQPLQSMTGFSAILPLDDVSYETSSMKVVFADGSTAYAQIDPSAPTPMTAQFSANTVSAAETTNATTKVDLVVTRAGDATTPATVDYASSDGTASERSDYLAAFGTLQFAAGETSKSITVFIVDDAFGEGPETFSVTLSNPVGLTLGSPSVLTVTINSDESVDGPNPVRDASFNTDFFVRQHYIDFFNREADAPGLAFWKNQIDECTTQACRDIRKINVSAAFFLSIEFQQTGYLVYKTNQAAFNSGEFLKLRDFLPDLQEIGRGVVIGQPGAEAQLEANKQKFFMDFVQRAKFLDPGAYPTTMTAAQFVDKLNTNTFDPLNTGSGGVLSSNQRDALVSQLAPNASAPALRAQVLRSVSENSIFNTRQSNKAFVLMQYFGYLRRNPNDPPEAGLDFAGYNFWLGKLNQFNGNFVNAEMVKAFIVSGEYQQRFGP
jgi:hypothetical protein